MGYGGGGGETGESRRRRKKKIGAGEASRGYARRERGVWVEQTGIEKEELIKIQIP